MSVNRVFELIRKGEMILFCGAGMSIYAGYPSGAALAKLIYDSMTTEEIEAISANLSLPELSEEYINLKLGKKSALLKILKDIFLKAPQSDHVHQIVARIPQIKTIITTNYDCLFENVYRGNCSIVKSSTDITYLDKGKTEVIKIHGDLSVPDSILISKSDYTKFFDSQLQNVLWTIVKERLATKNVLFVGYSLDDINVESIFRKITEELGSHTKEVFLLSPNEKEHKVKALNRKGIHYINSYAEPFFVDLERTIRDNVNDDFKNKLIDAETYRRVLSQYDLMPSLTTQNNGFQLKSVIGINKPLRGELQISIPADDEDTIKRVRSLFSNRDISSITLNDANVAEMLVRLNGVRFPSPIGQGIKLKPRPGIIADIDFIFNNGKEYEDVRIEVFKTVDYLAFVIPQKCSKITIKVPHDTLKQFPRIDLAINFDHKIGYQRINDELETYRFVMDLVSAGGMTVSNPKMKKMQFLLDVDESMVRECEKHLHYFEGLKKIERYFDVKFGDIKNINKATYNTLCWLLDVISGEEQICDWDDELVFQGTIPEKTMEALAHFDRDEEVNFTHSSSDPHIVNFHDCNINVGYQIIRLITPYVVNRSEVNQNPDTKVIIKSKSNQRAVRFVSENPNPANPDD